MYSDRRWNNIEESCDVLSAPLRKRMVQNSGEDLFTYI